MLCETTKINLTYSEIVNLEYPEFVFTKNYIQETYNKILADLEEKREGR